MAAFFSKDEISSPTANPFDDNTLVVLSLLALGSLALIYAIFSRPGSGEDIAVLPFLAALAIISAHASLKSPYLVFKILVFLVVFQNIVLIVLSNFFSSAGIFSLMIAKDLFAVVALVIFLSRTSWKQFRFTRVDYLALAFLALNIFYLFFFHSQSIFVRLVSFKENVMLYLLFFLGRTLPLDDEKFHKSVKLIINAGIFVALFGFLERFFLGDQFWIGLGIHELAKDQKVYDVFRFEAFGKEIASPMFYFVGNLSLRRLASISAQPPLTSHFLALPFLILFFSPSMFSSDRVKVFLARFSIGLAILLTIGRAGILIVGIGIILAYWKKSWRKGAALVILLVFGVLAVNMLSSVFNLQYGIFSLQHGGGRHLAGLVMAMASLNHPFGHGLASGGDYASWYGDEEIREISTWESYVGSLGYQMGLIGLGLFLMICLSLFYLLFVKKQKFAPPSQQKFNQAVGAAVLGMMVAAFFSAAASGFQSSGFYFVYAGLCLSRLAQARGKALVA